MLRTTYTVRRTVCSVLGIYQFRGSVFVTLQGEPQGFKVKRGVQGHQLGGRGQRRSGLQLTTAFFLLSASESL